jgi:serine/threonine protein phosphatase PrpC
MDPITDIAQLSRGDVLRHPTYGLARIADVDAHGRSVRLAWDGADEGRPRRVGLRDLGHDWRRCPPGSFQARRLADPAGLRRLMERSPAQLLILVLDQSDAPMPASSAIADVVDAGLADTERAQAWWTAATQAASSAPALIINDGTARLRDAAPIDDNLAGWEDLFLQLPPSAQARRLAELGAGRRIELLEHAGAHRDAGVLHLLLQSDTPIPERAVYGLVDLALGGDLVVATTLLRRAEPAATGAFARMASAPDRRPLLLSALERLSRLERRQAVLCLMERALGDGMNAASVVFLADNLPDGNATVSAFDNGESAARFPLALSWLQGQSSSTTMELELPDEGPLLTEMGPISESELHPIAMALARAMAHRHAQGAAGGLPGARRAPNGEVTLGAPEENTPAGDVRQAMHTLLRLAVGSLPRRRTMSDDALLAHLAALVPELSPDLVSVITRSVSEHPHLRPSNGIDLWEQLAQADGIATVRSLSPDQPRALYQVAHDTHIGQVKSRIGQTNQDALFYSTEGDVSLLVVADGISVATAGSGNLASALLVQVLANHWDQHAHELGRADIRELHEFLTTALDAANRTVCDAAVRLAGGDLGRHIPMGTTVVVALLKGSVACIASQGDSRAYLVSTSGAAQLTPDQNLRGEWLLSWQRGEAMEMLNDGYALTGYVGHFDDNGDPHPAVAFQRTLRMLPGETLILVTDGITDYAADDPAEMCALLETAAREPDLGRACRSLTEAANAGGGGDNITVIMARLSGA